jgi:hypothetical protein
LVQKDRIFATERGHPIRVTNSLKITSGTLVNPKKKVGIGIIQFNSIQFFYFNVLTQQLQVPITESAQEDKHIHSKEINI